MRYLTKSGSKTKERGTWSYESPAPSACCSIRVKSSTRSLKHVVKHSCLETEHYGIRALIYVIARFFEMEFGLRLRKMSLLQNTNGYLQEHTLKSWLSMECLMKCTRQNYIKAIQVLLLSSLRASQISNDGNQILYFGCFQVFLVSRCATLHLSTVLHFEREPLGAKYYSPRQGWAGPAYPNLINMTRVECIFPFFTKSHLVNLVWARVIKRWMKSIAD